MRKAPGIKSNSILRESDTIDQISALLSVYGDPKKQAWLNEEFKKAGEKLDMGKPCLRGADLVNALSPRALAVSLCTSFVAFP